MGIFLGQNNGSRSGIWNKKWDKWDKWDSIKGLFYILFDRIRK